jgi:hypothetical protein
MATRNLPEVFSLEFATTLKLTIMVPNAPQHSQEAAGGGSRSCSHNPKQRRIVIYNFIPEFFIQRQSKEIGGNGRLADFSAGAIESRRPVRLTVILGGVLFFWAVLDGWTIRTIGGSMSCPNRRRTAAYHPFAPT